MSLFRRKARPAAVPVDATLGDPLTQRFITAVDGDDLDALRGVFSEAGTPQHREHLTGLLDRYPDHVPTFERWTGAEPECSMAWSALGMARISQAWAVRGAQRAQYVAEDAWEVFFEGLRQAEDALERAIVLDPADPVPWSHLLTSGRGLQVPKEELALRFEEVQRRQPDLYGAHMQYLQGICEKWSGSHAEALEFGRRVSERAPDGSPLHAVLAMAHIEFWLDQETIPAETFQSAEREITAAAQRSVDSPAFGQDPSCIDAMNVIATGLYVFEEKAAAAALAKRIGTRRTDLPWCYVADGGVVYAELLSA